MTCFTFFPLTASEKADMVPKPVCQMEGTVLVRYQGHAKHVKIAEGVTEIGACAFAWCTDLQQLTLPASVTRVGHYAFMGCTALNVLHVYSHTSIEADALTRCPARMYAIDAPPPVQPTVRKPVLSPSTLSEPRQKSPFVIAQGVLIRYVGTEQHVEIPVGVKEIGNSAFSGNTTMKSVHIPEGVTTIQYGAFQKCKALQDVRLPSSLREIGGLAFTSCVNLCDIDIPLEVHTIGGGCFVDCVNLQWVNLPKKLQHIPRETFYGCKNLTTITIPDSVETIGSAAFHGCTALHEIKLSHRTKLSEDACTRCHARLTYTDEAPKSIVPEPQKPAEKRQISSEEKRYQEKRDRINREFERQLRMRGIDPNTGGKL